MDGRALDSSVWQAPGIEAEKFARTIVNWSITINVIVSMGTFHPALLPAGVTLVQQVVALAMWGVLIYASLFIRPRLRLAFNLDTLVIVAFYAFATISVFWTDLGVSALMKAAALAITMLGAFCMVTRADLDDIVKSTTRGLFVLIAGSALCAVILPDIGVDQTWMHNGQWQGVFESKQTLGFAGAYLMFFACYRKVTGQGWLPFLVTFVLASTCVIFSESRGAGALSLVACALLLTSLWSVRCMQVYAMLPCAMCIVAALLMLYFYTTGYDSIHVFDTAINLTERTYIWQYAISHFDDAPLFGFGINGFWTKPEIYDYFNQNHGWVLDNYHNGYIAILVETGFIGYFLFTASVFLFSYKVLCLIAGRAIDRLHCALIIGFVFLNCQTNFTETVFLRSTMFTSVLLIGFFLAVCRSVPSSRVQLCELERP
ncbi:O-antigen ligase family protein [Bradyrhizobium sp. CER78]|uniref:O-antigen ligase family protein n=1 Tax=Bradyrhizobium sp. CER78 TaxID=3039162 RepID=UPI00244A5E2F|nr:O-antigen ligase family protein [Bradyrhizobium sp. CER78]MDH2383583.1 O-antigen ligase family protein [Bradyrhizobium sp. CER78]